MVRAYKFIFSNTVFVVELKIVNMYFLRGQRIFMKITLRIETHAYVEEKLADEILDESLPDDIQSCGILGPEIIVPLRRNRNCKLDFEYTEKTTLRDVVYAVLERLDSLNHGIRIAFFKDGLRYWIENLDADFKTILSKYLDPHGIGEIFVAAYVSMDAGAIDEEDGVRYYMNSREAGRHHEPHVHICDTSRQYEAVILIKDGKVIGNFPSKLLKKAKRKVMQNQAFFLEQWNVLTDGIKIDVNHYLGTIHY